MARCSESPHSSEGVSLKDVSPETNITAYTPGDVGNGKAPNLDTPSKGNSITTKPFPTTSSALLTPVKPAPTMFGRSLTPGTAESKFTIKGMNSLYDPFIECNNAFAQFALSTSQAQDAIDLKKLSATAKDFHPNHVLIRDSVPDIVSSTPYAKAVLKDSTPLPKPVLGTDPLARSVLEKLTPKTPPRSDSFGLYKEHSPPSQGLLSPRHNGPRFSTDGEVRRYVFIGNINYAKIFEAEIKLAKVSQSSVQL